MWPDRVSNPEPLTCESGALPTALRGPAASYHVRDKHLLNLREKSCFKIFVIKIILVN